MNKISQVLPRVSRTVVNKQNPSQPYSKSTAFNAVKQMDVLQFQEIITDDKLRGNYQLLDVREKHELDIASFLQQAAIMHMPMSTSKEWIPMVENGEVLDATKSTIIVCRSGVRSMNIAIILDRLGFQEVFNLEGGILCYADRVDPAIPKY